MKTIFVKMIEDITDITTYTFNNVLRYNGFILLFHTIMQDKIPLKYH